MAASARKKAQRYRRSGLVRRWYVARIERRARHRGDFLERMVPNG